MSSTFTMVRYLAAASLCLEACSLLTNLDELGVGAQDGGHDAIAAQDFQVSVLPTSIVLAAGQNVPVTVSVQRFAGFTGIIDITIYGLPPGAAPNPVQLPMTPNVNSAPVTITAQANMNAYGDFVATVAATSGNEFSSAPLAVHVPGLVAAFTDGGATTLNVAANVTTIRVKAWGAGGGGGGTGGAPGGGGGFVQLDLPVTPLEVLGVTIGSGGYTGSTSSGGGGDSIVQRGTTNLLYAAGGGGGGWGPAAGAGGAGGGATGKPGADGVGCSGNGGGGATQTADGSGGGPGGGGGQGLHTGGVGGKCADGGMGGGGGGSSWPPTNSMSGSGRTPANNADVDYVAQGASAGWGGGGGSAGSDGLVVILVP